MYNKKLSEIFDRRSKGNDLGGEDEEGYPWIFHANSVITHKKKIFYAIGDSWLDCVFFKRVFHNQYPEYFLINQSIRGMSNGVIIDMIRNDVELLKSLSDDIIFLVSFSEVGRSVQELKLSDPKNFSSTHDYFGEILKTQYQLVKDILKDYSHFITTAFITNNFNQNNSILNFCGHSKFAKPENTFTVYSNGIFEFLKDRNRLFKFNFADDVDKSLKLKKFILSHDSIDDTLHPDRHKPYEDFLENVFLNLQKT